MPKIIIFTDLDGTLLDHKTYSFKKAKPALEKIEKTETPVIFVTSKTFAEIEVLQKEMGLWEKEPFVAENGGAIFIPEKFFGFDIRGYLPKEKVTRENEFLIIEFGKPYDEVRKVLKSAANELGIKVSGIGDMATEQFAKITSLSLKIARRAKQRRYQEGFIIENLPKKKLLETQKKLKEKIEKRGFYMSIGGRFYQISGEPAKIKAVKILIDLFKKKYGQIKTIGLGDAPSDLEFMELCDESYLIKNPNNFAAVKTDSKIQKTKKTGPEAWNDAVLNFLAEIKN